MSDIKTFVEWEKEKGWVYKAITAELQYKQMTETEFQDFVEANWGDFHPVNHADRIKFLQDNGHQVTRKNMIDHRLSAGGTIIESL